MGKWGLRPFSIGANIHFQYTKKVRFFQILEIFVGILNFIVSLLAYFQYPNRKKRPSNIGNKKISNIGGAILEIRVFVPFSIFISNIARVPKLPKNPKKQ